MREIITVDCRYMDIPQFAAAYLLIDGDRAAFVDNNTNHAVPRLLGALAAAGLEPAQVEYIIITHVHLDHAGGTSRLAAACPEATVIAHPRAARHVIDPERLVASATAVYGEEEFERLYGSILPVPAARVRSMEDGETLRFGEGELTFLHTRGHANHHFCIADGATGSLFTGDAFGLVYPALQREGLLAYPSTTPTDFDAALARDAVRLIRDYGAERLYLTHFGEVTEQQPAAGQLLRHLDFAEQLMLDAEASDQPDEALTAFVQDRLREHFAGLLDGYGSLAADPAVWRLLEMDIDLNAQGIAFAANRRRRKARESRT